MKALIVTLSTLFVIVKDSIAQDDGNGLYSRRYERLDIDTILASPRLVTNYVDCLLSKKPCPPEGKALKRILPEALRTKCGRCWPSQKEGALKVITALYYDYPQHYQALRERWDPTGEYNRRFEEYLHDQRFNVINSNAGQDGIEQGDTSQVTLTQLTDNNIRSNFIPRTRQASTSSKSSEHINRPNVIVSRNGFDDYPDPSSYPKNNRTNNNHNNHNNNNNINVQRTRTQTTTRIKNKGNNRKNSSNRNTAHTTAVIQSTVTPTTFFSHQSAPVHVPSPPFEFNMSTILQDIMRALFSPLRSLFA